jgi:murein DD-endopeptidase MepM/ murein hydrolase activator NlpD
MKIIQQSLQVQKSELENKKQELSKLKEENEDEKSALNGQQNYQQVLLTETQSSEKKFQSMLAELQRERQAAESNIANIESAIRDKLSRQESWQGDKDVFLDWPIPLKKITCYFHDTDYPFRKWIGEHSGVDLRASQGTAIHAPASGYIARAKDAGMGYSYIMVVHNDQISTVYGHVSKIFVTEDTYVTKGQIIGLTGGMPGTPGAGSMSTGPHLHFEVRLNGIPVNPLDYLP